MERERKREKELQDKGKEQVDSTDKNKKRITFEACNTTVAFLELSERAK